MVTSFISRLILPLLFFTFLFLYWAFPSQAASPGISVTTSADRHYVYLTFQNLRSVKSVAYTLTYTSGTQTKGFSGRLTPAAKSSRAVRRQILGSCSTRRCVFHLRPHAFSLEADFTLRSGGIVSLSRSLP